MQIQCIYIHTHIYINYKPCSLSIAIYINTSLQTMYVCRDDDTYQLAADSFRTCGRSLPELCSVSV